jgi:hypothetical protein
LFEFLMPPKNSFNSSGGACLFFDIDVKRGKKNSGALVAINAKGGDCWQMSNRKRMLVIDGKYNSEDGRIRVCM